MKWCCLGFEGFYGNAGQQGAAILVGRDYSGYPEFTLQYRVVDEGEQITINSEKPVASVVDVGIQYCPWCGSHLYTWYGTHVDILYRPHLKITSP